MADDVGTPINTRGSFLQSDPLRNFRFLVKFRPYETESNHVNPIKNSMFGFTSVSGLTVATEAIPYREGGMNTTLHQIPGQSTFSPITLSRGVHLNNKNAWRWMRRMFSVTATPMPKNNRKNSTRNPNSSNDYNFRASVDIMVLTHPPSRSGDRSGLKATEAHQGSQNDTIALSFRVYNAWISSLAYSDLNAGDNAILVEQMVLAHEGFDMYWWNGKEPDGYKAPTANSGSDKMFPY